MEVRRGADSRNFPGTAFERCLVGPKNGGPASAPFGSWSFGEFRGLVAGQGTGESELHFIGRSSRFMHSPVRSQDGSDVENISRESEAHGTDSNRVPGAIGRKSTAYGKDLFPARSLVYADRFPRKATPRRPAPPGQ